MRSALLLAVVACAAPGPGAEVAAIRATLVDAGPVPRDTELDQVVRDAIDDGGYLASLGVGVAVVENGHVVHVAGYGLRDRENDLPFTEDTAFAIGSCSKAFTGFALAMVATDGGFNLETPVKSVLPTFATADSALTHQGNAIDLLAHRTGLPAHNMLVYRTGHRREELMARLPYLEDSSAGFRQSFIYNNVMYTAAGAVLEKVARQTWEEFVEGLIFQPAGMLDSTPNVSRLLERPNHAVPYQSTGRLQFWDVRGAAPAGSIVSTPRDMARWLRLLIRRGVTESGALLISPQSFDQLFADHNQLGPGRTYGLGWNISRVSGERLVHHSGALDGYFAFVVLMPERNMGVVVLVNDHRSPLTHRVAGALFERLLVRQTAPSAVRDAVGVALQTPFAIPTPIGPEPSVAGGVRLLRYRHPAYGDLDQYWLPGNTYALKNQDRVWPITQCTGLQCTMRVRGAGVDFDLPFEGVVSGPTLAGLTLHLETVPQFFALTAE